MPATKTVSGMLGHYSAGFTLNTYAHATTASQRETAKRWGTVSLIFSGPEHSGFPYGAENDRKNKPGKKVMKNQKPSDFSRNQRISGCRDRTWTCDLRVMSCTPRSGLDGSGTFYPSSYQSQILSSPLFSIVPTAFSILGQTIVRRLTSNSNFDTWKTKKSSRGNWKLMP